MQIKVRIDGKEYPLVLDDGKGDFSFTPREWTTIRRISGYRKFELAMAISKGDMGLFMDDTFGVALAAVALARAGQYVDEDSMLDGVTTIEVEWPKEEETAGPPAEAAQPGGDPDAANSPTTTSHPEATGRRLSPVSTASSPGT